jgi:hypothetical protein
MPGLDIPQQANSLMSTLEDTHARVEVEPSALPHLGFEIVVPRGWAVSSSFGPVPSGLFESKGLGFFACDTSEGAPVIAVTATTIPYEVPVDLWARMVLEHEGYEIVSASWFPGASGLFFDITGVRTEGETRYVRRSGVRNLGNEVLCVNCMCVEGHWNAAKEVFWIALSSFELTQPGGTRMEAWARGVGVEPGFEFAFPGTWLGEPVGAAPPGISAVDVRLPGEDEPLMAYLQVRAERLTQGQGVSLASLEASAHARLASSGYQPSEPAAPLTEAEDPRSAAVKGWLGGFFDRGRLLEGEVWVRRGYIERDGLAYSLLLISPLRSSNPIVWLRAQRTFEIARATLATLAKL